MSTEATSRNRTQLIPEWKDRIGALFIIAVLLWLARVIALVFNTPWIAFTATGIIFAVLALVNIALSANDDNKSISIAIFAFAIGVVVIDTVLGQLSSARRIAAIFLHMMLGAVIVGLVVKLQAEPPTDKATKKIQPDIQFLTNSISRPNEDLLTTTYIDLSITPELRGDESKLAHQLSVVLQTTQNLERLMITGMPKPNMIDDIFKSGSGTSPKRLLKLKQLDLHGNSLIAISKNINAPYLTHLSLQNNKIPFTEFESLKTRFPMLIQLTVSQQQQDINKLRQLMEKVGVQLIVQAASYTYGR